MKKKIEPRLIDIEYIDRELNELFNSVPYGSGEELFVKYRSRFMKEQIEKNDVDSAPTTNSMLSVGKKLEILCTYGNHTIIKINKKSKAIPSIKSEI